MSHLEFFALVGMLCVEGMPISYPLILRRRHFFTGVPIVVVRGDNKTCTCSSRCSTSIGSPLVINTFAFKDEEAWGQKRLAVR